MFQETLCKIRVLFFFSASGRTEACVYLDLNFFCLYLRMASQGEPVWNGPRSGSPKFILGRGPADQEEEEVSEVSFPSPGLISVNYSSQEDARAEVWKLYKLFWSWLQPEKHSKEEMISSLTFEQFLLTRRFSERATWREKWKSSGGNLKLFIDALDKVDLRPSRSVSGRF